MVSVGQTTYCDQCGKRQQDCSCGSGKREKQRSPFAATEPPFIHVDGEGNVFLTGRQYREITNRLDRLEQLLRERA